MLPVDKSYLLLGGGNIKKLVRINMYKAMTYMRPES